MVEGNQSYLLTIARVVYITVDGVTGERSYTETVTHNKKIKKIQFQSQPKLFYNE